MKNTFEQHLQAIFIEDGDVDGIGITKDNCEDLFESWIENNIDIVMEEGQKFAEICYQEGKNNK